MSKLEEFKNFMYKHPEFIDYAKENNISYQKYLQNR
jgi:hypothetical protein